MKIYVLPVDPAFQPDKQPFLYPAHNEDYGVEQDFLRFLNRHPEFVASDPYQADWHYLPVFWTRYHLNHDFGKWGLDELRQELNRVLLNDAKTFTIVQYDWGTLVDVGRTLSFFSSRITDYGLDIPLLCSPHALPAVLPPKRYLASFSGHLNNHPVRHEMANALAGNGEVSIVDGNYGPDFFIDQLLSSYVALCPRGHGGSSFRFCEAMQAGVVPFLIGDLDTRPFKSFLPWEEASFYARNGWEAAEILRSTRLRDLEKMGKKAYRIWKEELDYHKWCRYVIRELEIRR
ncbi:exostosin domain-containing protein [Cohnella caldifontis]|uniref:exostosin domain-containing protein n=1 Tax=Cohnella caldifontis TaxID=3027471 RepID=UPI0023EDEEDF|nr:exostosin family protein [Cohnella sp. YIM B05605]